MYTDGVITYLDFKNTKLVLRKKVINIFDVLNLIDTDLLSVHYEDIVDEFEFVFFNANDNDSGKIILTIRNCDSKIYIHGFKFKSQDLPLNLDANIGYILKLALAGEYYVTEKMCRGKIHSRKIEFMNVSKNTEFGLFRSLFNKKFSELKYKGTNYLKHTYDLQIKFRIYDYRN
jgi:hypothetical protein